MTRQSFTLCIALLLLAMAGSWAMYLLGIDQGAEDGDVPEPQVVSWDWRRAA